MSNNSLRSTVGSFVKGLSWKAIQRSKGKRVYVFLGMMRSGNHALINWISAQQPGLMLHLNGILDHQRPYEDNLGVVLNMNFGKGAFKSGAYAKTVIASYESSMIENIFSKENTFLPPLSNAAADQTYSVLLMRDPFNLFASWYAWTAQGKSGSIHAFRDSEEFRYKLRWMWKAYAREFVGETKHMKDFPNVVFINYNRWFQDEGYKKQLADQLGMQFGEKGLDKVSGAGAGSSFDERAFHGKARDMKVLSRWEKIKDTEIYKELIADEELVHLSNQIFGIITD